MDWGGKINLTYWVFSETGEQEDDGYVFEHH